MFAVASVVPGEEVELAMVLGEQGRSAFWVIGVVRENLEDNRGESISRDSIALLDLAEGAGLDPFGEEFPREAREEAAELITMARQTEQLDMTRQIAIEALQKHAPIGELIFEGLARQGSDTVGSDLSDELFGSASDLIITHGLALSDGAHAGENFTDFCIEFNRVAASAGVLGLVDFVAPLNTARLAIGIKCRVTTHHKCVVTHLRGKRLDGLERKDSTPGGEHLPVEVGA